MTPETQQPEQPPPLASRIMKIAAWPLSGIIGWWWTNHEAGNSLYDMLKHTGEFRENVRQPHWKNVNKIASDGLAEARINASGAANIIKPLVEERQLFGKARKAYFEKLGFGSYSTVKYLRTIHPEEAMKAGMMGFGAATFTLGAILALAETRTLENLLRKRNKEQQQDQSPSK